MQTVKRGAGRAAHAEKTNRHAQRTPLPPKPGQVEDARDAIAAADGVKPYGKMTQAELLSAAQELGLNPPKRSTKEALRVAILDVKQSHTKAPEKKAAKPRPRKEVPAQSEAPSSQDGLTAETIISRLGGTKSDVKAASFMRAADSLSWRLDSASSKGNHTEVTVTRGSEAIHIGWIDGVFIYDECLYTNAGRGTVKLRNASAAKKRMTMNADEASEEAARIQHRRAAKDSDGHRNSGKDSPVKRQRPPKFSDAMLDDQILDAVRGKKITWVNRISGGEESDWVPPAEAHRKNSQAVARINEGRDGRFISFLGAAGYRSVLIKSIVHVSR